ncbi:MAG: carbohydrate ABC transporter permease, partial [Chloroflexota bacterium]
MSQTKASKDRQNQIRDWAINGALILIVVIWTIPTFGLLISSFRSRFDLNTTGWWLILPHREWITVETIEIPDDVDRDGAMEFAGASGTFEELREGVAAPDGKQVTWVGNKRLGRIEVQER